MTCAQFSAGQMIVMVACLHDSRRQVISDASIADFMLKHVHALGEIVQVDILATDHAVLLSAN